MSRKSRTVKAATVAAPVVTKAAILEIIADHESKLAALKEREDALVADRREQAPLAALGDETAKTALVKIRAAIAEVEPKRQEITEALDGLRTRVEAIEREEAKAAAERRRAECLALIVERCRIADAFDDALRSIGGAAELLFENAAALNDYRDVHKVSFERVMSGYSVKDAFCIFEPLRRLLDLEHCPPHRRRFLGLNERGRFSMFAGGSALPDLPKASAQPPGFTPRPLPEPAKRPASAAETVELLGTVPPNLAEKVLAEEGATTPAAEPVPTPTPKVLGTPPGGENIVQLHERKLRERVEAEGGQWAPDISGTLTERHDRVKAYYRERGWSTSEPYKTL